MNIKLFTRLFISMNRQMCKEDGCTTIPIFNVSDESKGLYCAKHKKDGMINVKSPTCLECNTRPCFNKEGQPNGLYCLAHKKQDMVNVIDKKCLECNKCPSYNYVGEKKTMYCVKHKKEGMIDVTHKQCKSEWCTTIVQKKYDGYCVYCYMNLFPDKHVSRNYKTKEYAVVDFVKTKFPDLEWITDKRVNGGCSSRRPDMLLDLFTQVIIIEIDENQHTEYDCSCQNKRIMELSQDVGHRPIVFIRFNPDDYTHGTTVTSCWGADKNGICVVKKTKISEIIQLFYDIPTHGTTDCSVLNTYASPVEWFDDENYTASSLRWYCSCADRHETCYGRPYRYSTVDKSTNVRRR